MVKCPCSKECPTREIGCHGKCEAYKEFRAFKDRIIEIRMSEDVTADYGRDERTRVKKHLHRTRRK